MRPPARSGVARTRRRAGFTLVELAIAMTIGLVVLAAALSFAVTTWRTQAQGQIGEDTARRARFIGTSLQRDIAEAGVQLPPLSTFGTVVAYGDTLALLRVPTRDTLVAPTYLVDVPTPAPTTGTGTCGATCLTLVKREGRVEIRPGDLVLLQNPGNLRRLLLASAVTDLDPSDSAARVRLDLATTPDSLFHWPSRLTGVWLSQGSTVQRLALTAYFRDRATDTTLLMRATQLQATGAFVPVIMSSGVTAWQVRLGFANGDSAAAAVPADTARNACAVSRVLVDATLVSDRPADARTAASAVATRRLRWTYQARNPVFQRNARRGARCP